MKHFIHTDSALCLLFCFAEQGMVAASTWVMIQIGKSVGEPGTAVFWVLVFMAVLLAVFVPKYGYDRFLLRAKYRTQGNYILAFEQSLEGKPYLFKDKAFYSRNRTIFQSEVWNVVNESFDFFLDGTLLLLNICFNVAVISASIAPGLAVGYLCSFFLVLVSSLGFCPMAERLSQQAQGAHIRMNTVLRYGWDTLILGNTYHQELWNRQMQDMTEQASDAGVKKLRVFCMASGLAMMVSSAPVFGLLIWLLLSCSGGEMAALVLTIPRQINTLQYLNSLISCAMNWNGIRARIHGIDQAVLAPGKLPFCPEYIRFSEIVLYEGRREKRFNSLKEAFQWEKWEVPGRITVRGANGAGKSTLLMGLKAHFGNRACYFSPYAEEFFKDSLKESCSTGQEALSHLRETFAYAPVKLFLLDEWDANLDQKNMENMDRFLEEKAKSCCIVEVRHR